MQGKSDTGNPETANEKDNRDEPAQPLDANNRTKHPEKAQADVVHSGKRQILEGKDLKVGTYQNPDQREQKRAETAQYQQGDAGPARQKWLFQSVIEVAAARDHLD